MAYGIGHGVKNMQQKILRYAHCTLRYASRSEKP